MAGMRHGEVTKEKQVSVRHLSCPSEDEWVCQAGTCICAQAGVWQGLAGLPRRAVIWGKTSHSPKPAWQSCLGSILCGGLHGSAGLCKAGGLLFASKKRKAVFASQAKEKERMEPGKGKEAKLCSHEGRSFLK